MNRRISHWASLTPRVNCYVAGATVRLRVEDVDGRVEPRAFRIVRRSSGGFAADVWQVRDLDTGRDYALKLFTAQTQRGLSNRCRKWLRDVAHLIWFQSPYPYRTCKAAVQHALLVRKLLHALSAIDEGTSSIVDAEGLVWEPRYRTYGVLLTWVEGRGPRYTGADGGLFTRRVRRSRHETPHWFARQRAWMAFARRWGFSEHAAQVYVGRRGGGAWFSLGNVRYAIEESAVDGRFAPERLRWLDLEPAFPQVVWLFWFHVRCSLEAWRRGVFPSFDRVDTRRLRQMLEQLDASTRRHWHVVLRDVAIWVQRLDEARRLYDRQRPNVWQHRWSLATDRTLRRDIRQGLITHWQRLDHVSARSAAMMAKHVWAFAAAWLVGWLPFVGGLVRRYGWQERYRRHVHRMVRDASYCLRVWRRGARAALWLWQREGRLPRRPLHAPLRMWCAHVWRAIVLPVRWHRWTSDARYRWWWFAGAYAFCWNVADYRQRICRWFFLRMLREERRRYQLSSQGYRRLVAALRRPLLSCYLEGHYLYVMPKVILWPLMLALAAWGIMLRSPGVVVSALFVGGVYRELVTCWLRLCYPQAPLGWALATAWIPKLGSLACTIQMARSLRRGERAVLFLALRRLVTAVSSWVPLLGGEGTLLEYCAIRCVLDVPYSLWRLATSPRTIAFHTLVTFAGPAAPPPRRPSSAAGVSGERRR